MSVIPPCIAYVLKTFPEPSETFVAEEALSVLMAGRRVYVIRIEDGNLTVMHRTAEELQKRAVHWRMGGIGRVSSVFALVALMMRSPARTFRTIWLALEDQELRWAYFMALPAALWCLRHQVDLVHAHFADLNFVLAHAISRWTDIPVGVTTHRYDILEDPIPRAKATALLQQTPLIVTISEFNRRHMIEKYDLAPERVRIVHCGIDLERFAFVDRPLRMSHQSLRILNVGRLAEAKAHDVLLKSIAQVKSLNRPVQLEIIGDGPLREGLESLARELGIAGQVVFHGAQNEAFVRERFGAADLFVLSSRSEGLPVVCMEALAVGVPLIATSIFGIPELVEHGVSGLLVPPDDPAALADAIVQAFDHPQKMHAMRRAGRRKVEESFERGQCTRELIALWSVTHLGAQGCKT